MASSCVNTGDTSWVLLSFILVLGMMPALAFFEGGLLRSKSTLSLIFQIFSGLAILSVMWDFIGYTLVYGKSWGGIIGNLDHVLLLNVHYDQCAEHAPTIPAAAFAVFQMMFAAISPLLMTGAFGERVKSLACILLMIGWEILVYYPLAHWIWGNGWLAKMGALDFAGGIVIHTSAGAGSLVCALVLRKRKGFDQWHGEFPPSNLPLAALGAALLWMGWFGFNAGSALSSGVVATSAVASTQIASSMSAVVWLVISWVRKGRPSIIALLNGAIAGLAGVTPASGYINSQSTIVLGLILGFGSYASVILLKEKLRIDDALDVTSVHGVTGVIGSLAIGFCAERSVNEEGDDGLIFSGSLYLFGIQLLAVVVAAALSSVVTYVLLKLIDRTVGLQITEQEEEVGIDHSEYGEIAYHQLHHANDPYVPHSHHHHHQLHYAPDGVEGVSFMSGGLEAGTN